MIRGSVYKFGDNINSDIIIPGRYLIHIDAPTLAGYAFEPLGKETQDRIKTHSILVAGRNFGCGSAREQAATAIQGVGIKAVIAASFARTFYRNAINDGLPIVECPALVEAASEGDEVEIDLAAGVATCNGKRYEFPKIPDSVRKILELGGLAAYLRTQLPQS